jgi:cytochrome c-type biogenesis protein CcmH/NrfG
VKKTSFPFRTKVVLLMLASALLYVVTNIYYVIIDIYQATLIQQQTPGCQHTKKQREADLESTSPSRLAAEKIMI